MWPDWAKDWKFLATCSLTKVAQKDCWLWTIWKTTINVKSALDILYATFVNIWATFLIQHLVTLPEKSEVDGRAMDGFYVRQNLTFELNVYHAYVKIFLFFSLSNNVCFSRPLQHIYSLSKDCQQRDNKSVSITTHNFFIIHRPAPPPTWRSMLENSAAAAAAPQGN